MKNNEFYTTKEAADILGLTEYTIRKKIRNKEIKATPGASVREGYKIDKESLFDFASRNKIAIAAIGAGLAATVGAPFVAPFVVGSGIVGLVAGLGLLDNEKDKGTSIKGKKELYDLGIQRLETEIEGLNLQIEALELDGDSDDNKKNIIQLKIRINELKMKIQEIKMQKEIDGN